MSAWASRSSKSDHEQVIFYLSVLELQPGATLQDIKRAYRDLCVIWHPDKNPGRVAQRATVKLQELNEAYAWLMRHTSLLLTHAIQVEHEETCTKPASLLQIWWHQLEPVWQRLFMHAAGICQQPTDDELQVLVQTQELNCGETAILDLRPVEKLTDLKKLECYKTSIQSLAPLEELHHLQEIDLWSTHVDDLSPLAHLHELHNLNCNETLIRDISPLQHLPNLRKFACSGTPIQHLGPLSNLITLTSLSCGETSIQNLEPLEHLTHLQVLYCSHTLIGSIKPLWKLPALRALFCQHTRIPLGEIWKFEREFPHCKVYY